VKALDRKLIPILEEKYGKYWWPVEYPKDVFSDPFKNLIITVLSQNTSEQNCVRAYKGLSASFDVKPEVLAKADTSEIKKSIRSGGLYNIKSKRIKELSKLVLEKFNGDLSPVLALPKQEAKKQLMKLPGVGDKTADVLLASRLGYHEVFVVDTHMDRIAKRLGLVGKNAKYAEIQDAIKHFVPKDKDDRTGGLFWLLAKYTCGAQHPKCHECPLTEICKYPKESKSQICTS
jgi:endonuclease-3